MPTWWRMTGTAKGDGYEAVVTLDKLDGHPGESGEREFRGDVRRVFMGAFSQEPESIVVAVASYDDPADERGREWTEDGDWCEPPQGRSRIGYVGDDPDTDYDSPIGYVGDDIPDGEE